MRSFSRKYSAISGSETVVKWGILRANHIWHVHISAAARACSVVRRTEWPTGPRHPPAEAPLPPPRTFPAQPNRRTFGKLSADLLTELTTQCGGDRQHPRNTPLSATLACDLVHATELAPVWITTGLLSNLHQAYNCQIRSTKSILLAFHILKARN